MSGRPRAAAWEGVKQTVRLPPRPPTPLAVAPLAPVTLGKQSRGGGGSEQCKEGRKRREAGHDCIQYNVCYLYTACMAVYCRLNTV